MSVSSHPRRARSAPSVWPPSGRPGSRPGPPGGTGRSWRRPGLTPSSVPWRSCCVCPGVCAAFNPGRGVSRRAGGQERVGADRLVTKRPHEACWLSRGRGLEDWDRPFGIDEDYRKKAIKQIEMITMRLFNELLL